MFVTIEYIRVYATDITVIQFCV